jgi:hypothetical protein
MNPFRAAFELMARPSDFSNLARFYFQNAITSHANIVI